VPQTKAYIRQVKYLDLKLTMNQQLLRPDRFFFGTRSLACPYIQGKTERKVVTDLSGANASELHERLTRSGFRRSHSLAYRPACPSCSACVPIRINVTSFQTTKSFQRINRLNSDLCVVPVEAAASAEQYKLFSTYQHTRHPDGDMSTMKFSDYRAMVEDTPVETYTVEFRDSNGSLLSVMLMDRIGDSLSAVYSFFDCRKTRRSLGTYMILWMVKRAQSLKLNYVYLGYWIDGSDKMAYKTRFQPVEILIKSKWRALDV